MARVRAHVQMGACKHTVGSEPAGSDVDQRGAGGWGTVLCACGGSIGDPALPTLVAAVPPVSPPFGQDHRLHAFSSLSLSTDAHLHRSSTSISWEKGLIGGGAGIVFISFFRQEYLVS